MPDDHKFYTFGPIGIYTAKNTDYHSVLLTVETENGMVDAVELIVSQDEGILPRINSNWLLFEHTFDEFPT